MLGTARMRVGTGELQSYKYKPGYEPRARAVAYNGRCTERWQFCNQL